MDMKNNVADEAPVGITIYDTDSEEFVYANDEFTRLTGYTEKCLSGKDYSILFGEESDDEMVNEVLGAVRNGETASFEIVTYTSDGDTFWNKTRVSPFEGGGEEYVLGVHEDVTERKRREDELRRRNERLNDFASIVSHDLQNPLDVVEKRLGSYAEEHDDRRIEHAQKGIERMREIIDGLLTLTSDSQVVGDDEGTDLEIAEVAETAWKNVDTEDVELEIETTRSVFADEERLVRVFENLMNNAVVHGGADVKVTVGDSEEGFYVEDDGPGIPEYKREKVFDRGFSTGGSNGFGLYIVKNIVEAHGWEIEVEEASDGGARIHIITDR